MAEPGHSEDETGTWIPQPGDVLAGRYRVEGLLGSGGMAAVLAAIQLDLNRRVALKIMPPRAAKKPAAVERFRREVRAASSIDSEHVVKVYEFGQLENGGPFMVMEFLVGSTLRRLVERRGPLAVHEALDYVLQSCVAIAHCHSIGIVHRDLKPENIMVCENPGQRGQVKVLDFGISKADWFDQEYTPNLTGTSDVFGTPTHMSPEQVRSSKNVDSRTDIWALGVTLYEVLTGRPPFMAESLPALSAMIVSDDPVDPQTLRPDLPPGLSKVVMKCLAKKPDQRPQSVQELAMALSPFCAPQSTPHLDRIVAITAVKPERFALGSSPSGSYPISARDTANAWGTTHHRRRATRRGILIGVGVGVSAFVLAGALFVIMRKKPMPQPDAEATASAAPQESNAAALPAPESVLGARAITPEHPSAAPATSADAGLSRKRPRLRNPLDDRR